MYESTVYLVEDEPLLAKAITRQLGTSGFQLAGHSRTGEEAIEAFGKHVADLALVDIGLPGAMDGIQTAHTLCNRFDVPVVFITGQHDIATLGRAMVAGPFGYVLKPFSRETLHSAIAVALDRFREGLHEREQARTDQARAKESTRRAQSAEEETQLKSRALSSLSHELRTPLNAILGFGHLLQEKNKLPVEQQPFLDHIVSAGQHMLTLVNDMLDLRRLEDGAWQFDLVPQQLEPIVQEAVDIIFLQAVEKDISLEVQSADSIAHAMVDRRAFLQVLINLLSNAVKFTPQGGSIKVRLCSQEDHILVEVTDSGCGIPRDAIEHIFSYWYQGGKHEYKLKGSGIGLAVTKALVEHQGGSITVTSEPDKGTTFRILAPANPSIIRCPPASPRCPPASPHHPTASPPRTQTAHEGIAAHT